MARRITGGIPIDDELPPPPPPPRSYIVRYDANGGSGTPSSQTVYAGSSVKLASGSGLRRYNYAFSGWNTTSYGLGSSYSAGQYYTPCADITMYAIWRKLTQWEKTKEGLPETWEKIKKGLKITGGVLGCILVLMIVGQKCSSSSNSGTTNTKPAPNTTTAPKPQADYAEGTRLDADGNGNPDFIVKNGRLTGTVSGKDFGPATVANFNSRKITEQDKANNWQWRDEKWVINGQSSSVMVFESAIKNCTGFTLGLKINDSVGQNFANSDLGLNWPVYVWTGSNKEAVSKVGDIKMTKKGEWIYANINFSLRNIKWILFQPPRRADGTWSGYSCSANISNLKF
jgi:hypothetical protein